MLYELRIYHAMPGRMPALNSRFENHTLKMWKKFGIRQVGFWTQMIGDNTNDLYYMLAWESLEEREEKWTAFTTNPEWLAIRAETEKSGPLVNHISNMILSPTAYSKMK
jgi:hypothetical protein